MNDKEYAFDCQIDEMRKKAEHARHRLAVGDYPGMWETIEEMTLLMNHLIKVGEELTTGGKDERKTEKLCLLCGAEYGPSDNCCPACRSFQTRKEDL